MFATLKLLEVKDFENVEIGGCRTILTVNVEDFGNAGGTYK